jgi:hypothetical protein
MAVIRDNLIGALTAAIDSETADLRAQLAAVTAERDKLRSENARLAKFAQWIIDIDPMHTVNGPCIRVGCLTCRAARALRQPDPKEDKTP